MCIFKLPFWDKRLRANTSLKIFLFTYACKKVFPKIAEYVIILKFEKQVEAEEVDKRQESGLQEQRQESWISRLQHSWLKDWSSTQSRKRGKFQKLQKLT